MKKLLALGILGIFVLNAKGQAIMEDVNGTPIKTTKSYTDIEGSPYLSPQWSKAFVRYANNKSATELEVKYDQVLDQLMFRTKRGDSLFFVDPVREFKISLITDNKLQPKYFRNGYAPTKTTTSLSYFEILADGTVQLLKRTVKKITNITAYSSATVRKRIAPESTYFLYKDGQLISVKNDKKSLMTVLGNSSSEMEAYVKSVKPDFRSDGDLAAYITHYNSIQGK